MAWKNYTWKRQFLYICGSRLLLHRRVQLLCICLAVPVPVTGIATGICILEESGKCDSGLVDVSCNILVTMPVHRLKVRQNDKSSNNSETLSKKHKNMCWNSSKM